MTFFESASLIGSQVLANCLAGSDVEKRMSSPYTASVFLAIIGFICISRGWTENSKFSFRDYSISFYTYVLGGKSSVLL